MRSKEVDEAIKRIGQLYNGISVGLIINVKSDGTTCKSLETVLSYIETLEKQIPTPSNEVPVEYQIDIWVNKRDAVMKSEIRDKIKELEEKVSKEKYVTHSWFIDKAKIEVLKEIIGE